MHFRGKVRYPAIRQLVTHTNYLAPYNLLMNTFSKLPNQPILSANEHRDLQFLKQHWRQIRKEALAVSAQGGIRAATELNDAGFHSFFKTGWQRFYLKWYDDPLPSAKRLCPQTVDLLEQTKSIRAAMFARLPGGASLTSHRDPFAGSLRYHLGLVTPNSEACYILIDGARYWWRDGDDILFDETYIHEAHNNTDSDRIVLFCDVNRPMKFRWLDRLNEFVSHTLMRASATQNEIGEPVGLVNRIFGKVYFVRTLARRAKRWNKPLYKATKVTMFLVLVYLIFF